MSASAVLTLWAVSTPRFGPFWSLRLGRHSSLNSMRSPKPKGPQPCPARGVILAHPEARGQGFGPVAGSNP
jgi:hypothetical protein